MKKSRLITLVSNVVIVAVIAVLAVTTLLSGNEQAAFAPITQGKRPQTAALTFNVYLGDEYVKQILTVLQQYQVTATFFLGGCWAVKHEETCQKLVQSGVCIGSHGYLHLDHSTLSYGENIAEINKAQKAIEQTCRQTPTLFAPPSGAYSANTLKAAEDLGYKVIMWSKDTIDWRDQDVDTIIARATQSKQSGDIVLMHPTAATVAALPAIIESYLAESYTLLSVDKLLQ